MGLGWGCWVFFFLFFFFEVLRKGEGNMKGKARWWVAHLGINYWVGDFNDIQYTLNGAGQWEGA